MKRWETAVQLAKSRIPEGDIGMTEPILFAITVVEMHDRICELEAAILAEREQCAEIAEAHASENDGFTEQQAAAQAIAAAIRARGTT